MSFCLVSSPLSSKPSQKIKKPNLFIVGAPRCGTTSMYYYLGQHPDIFMSKIKEPRYFDTDQRSNELIRHEKDYLALFARAKNETYLGEASPTYLYSQKAAERIKKFSPQARIIIMLRNPIDMMHSLYNLHLHNGVETNPDFAVAIESKKASYVLPSYKACAQYARHVKRYLNIFNRNHVHIIIFDDFKKDTLRTYRQTLKFLKVDDQFIPNFKIANPLKQARIRALNQFINFPPKILVNFLRITLPRLVRFHLKDIIGKTLIRLNTKHPSPMPINPQLRKRLREEFSPEVDKLGKLLQRDLSPWATQ